MDNHDTQITQLLQNRQTLLQVLEDDNEFWDLIVCATGYVCLYYLDHIYKEPCYTSYLTGAMWINELLTGHEKRCFNTFRMNQNTFRQLCMDLGNNYGLKSSDRMSILEKVGLFVYILSKGASNRDAQERFQHSGETVSRVFKEVLDAMDGLSRDIIRPRDPQFKEVPPQITNDVRYMPHFKVTKYVLIHLYFLLPMLIFHLFIIYENCFIPGLHWSY